MPLIFPTNPILNQTYQSGSSATYIWNGFYWDIETAPTATVITAASASVAFSATTASFASTGSSVNTLNQSVIVSGSFTVFTGSAVEFQVHDVGVKLGSVQTDRHQVTGSLSVTGSITGSLFGTASFATTASYALSSAGSGGGGGVASFATIKPGLQSITTFPQDITWQTLNTTGSGVTLPSGSGTAFIRIPSGSWRITTSLYVSGFSNTTAGAAQVELVNVSNASIPGFAPMYFIPITSTGTDIIQGTVDGVLTVTTPTTTIKVRATGGAGTSNISAAFTTGMIIQRIS